MLVDIPMDLSRAEIDYEPVTDVRLPGYQPRVEGNQKQIRQAAKALAAAQRPVIYAGGGVVNAEGSAELIEFVRSDRFPVTCTLMGLGAYPAPDPQWLGMLGMHGTRAANYAMDEADLICAVGARFDDRITGKLSEFAPRAKFIHIDVDPAEISKNVPAHIPIVGDAKHVLAKLLVEYRAIGADPGRLEAWWSRIEGWREKYPLAYEDSADNEIKPQFMIQALWRGDRGRGDRHERRRPAPDVDGAVLRLPRAAPLDQLRRARHDGLRPAGRDGRRRRLPRSGGLLHRRRRLGADERAGARDLRAERDPDQGVHHEQRLPGHGPPVAGAVLGRQIQPRRHG